jgi:DNA polymerase elongation subunit (family B)
MINYQQIGEQLYISYYDTTGHIRIQTVQIPISQQFNWEHCSDDDTYKVPDIVSQTNQPVKRVKAKYLNHYRIIEFLNSLPEDFKSTIFKNNTPEKWFMDIECESINGEFPDETLAIGRILTNAFCNTKGEIIVTGIKPLTKEQIQKIQIRVNEHLNKVKDGSLKMEYKVKYKYYENEKIMLDDLAYNFIPKMPFISGWNFLKYDMRYIVNRCKKNNIDFKKMSPKHSFYILTLADKFNKDIRHKIELPYHRGIVDYQELYKKFDTSQKLKTSLTLDDVSFDVLGVPKVHFSGNFMDLYNNQYEDYVFYNAVDCVLPMLIDKKLGTLNTLLKLGEIGKTPLLEAFFASDIATVLFELYFLERKTVFVELKDKPERIKYEGAYVKEPEVGIKGDVLIADYESEFPSIMMYGNIGIDTLLGILSDTEPNCYYDLLGNKKPLDKENHIVMSNKTVYDKTKQSSLRTLVGQIFGQRIDAKNNVETIESEIDYLKNLLKK